MTNAKTSGPSSDSAVTSSVWVVGRVAPGSLQVLEGKREPSRPGRGGGDSQVDRRSAQERLARRRRTRLERGVDGHVDAARVPAQGQPVRQRSGGVPAVGAPAGHLEHRHVHAGRDVGVPATGRMVEAHTDIHRARDRLEHGIHGDVRRGLVEQRHPLAFGIGMGVRRPQDLVDETLERLALVVVAEDGLQPVQVAAGGAEGSPNHALLAVDPSVRPIACASEPKAPRLAASRFIGPPGPAATGRCGTWPE